MPAMVSSWPKCHAPQCMIGSVTVGLSPATMLSCLQRPLLNGECEYEVPFLWRTRNIANGRDYS
jgi:hypothetical protein